MSTPGYHHLFTRDALCFTISKDVKRAETLHRHSTPSELTSEVMIKKMACGGWPIKFQEASCVSLLQDVGDWQSGSGDGSRPL